MLITVTMFACAVAQDERPCAQLAEPMASFARMIGGEWKMTAQSGTSMYDRWQWGPGQHSLRMVTEGEAADGSPWRALQVVYWHPGRMQIRLLTMHPDVPGVGRGVGDGTISFAGDTLDASLDLYQSRGPRKLRSRSVFEGPDKYHATLLESSGPGGYQPLADWDYFRVDDLTAKTSDIPEGALSLPDELRLFEPLVGHTWDATGEGEDGKGPHFQSTFEFVPLAEYVYGRTVDVTGSGLQAHILDMYFYHHVGADALRCLALSGNGGVYEGEVSVPEAGALQIDLNGYEGERIIPYVIRLDFERDGTLRQRIWSSAGSERKLVSDALHKKIKS